MLQGQIYEATIYNMAMVPNCDSVINFLAIYSNIVHPVIYIRSLSDFFNFILLPNIL